MTARDRLDPETRDGLDLFLAAVPGGFGAIPDIVQRRAVAEEFLQLTTAGLPPNDQVISQERIITGPPDNPELTVRVYTPAQATGVRLPGILMIHGGGMIMGSVAAEHIKAETYCEAVNAVIVSTDYRKAPENPYPAGPDDCYAALNWMVDHADELDIDPMRIAVLGGSAGGNLAISTTLRARDLAGPTIAYLMAPYPMLDQRNTKPSSHEITDIGVWDRATNVEAWDWYLDGQSPDAYAAPAHADDLSGLPPTFIDVGTLDAFRDEDIAFVGRLAMAGVPVEFHLYPGAFHASEVFAPAAELSQRITATRIAALRRALHG
jgi:acetyl esterase/lipase